MSGASQARARQAGAGARAGKIEPGEPATATWADLEREAPDIAAAGRVLLFHPGVGFGYLATVRADGGPRLHPVNVQIVDGRLLVFVVPSPKLADLRRDGRFALHSTGSETVDDEFYLAGRAQVVEDRGRIEAARRASPTSVGPDHVLVELAIERAMWSEFARPPRWPPTYHRWRSAGISG